MNWSDNALDIYMMHDKFSYFSRKQGILWSFHIFCLFFTSSLTPIDYLLLFEAPYGKILFYIFALFFLVEPPRIKSYPYQLRTTLYKLEERMRVSRRNTLRQGARSSWRKLIIPTSTGVVAPYYYMMFQREIVEVSFFFRVQGSREVGMRDSHGHFARNLLLS